VHSESQWRYRAQRRGLRLVKYRRDTPAYDRFGPYGLVDIANRTVIATGLDAETIERHLFAPDLTTAG